MDAMKTYAYKYIHKFILYANNVDSKINFGIYFAMIIKYKYIISLVL